MTDPNTITAQALARIARPLRLTRAAMAAERLARCFWPVSTLLLAVAAALAFGVQDHLTQGALWGLALALAVALLAALVLGLRRFRWPSRAEAMARLDGTLPGHPLAALTDAQALGAGDAASAAVWRAHLQRMAARAAAARAAAPDLRLASRDRFGLRYVALTGFVMALIFGAPGRVGEVATIAAGGTPAQAAAGPSWEGWVEPPAYTGRPSLYLNAIEAATLEVPEGSLFTFRFYGSAGAIALDETISAGEAPVAEPAEDGPRSAEFAAAQTGTVRIDGPGGREIAVTVLPDAAPSVTFAGDIEREADGEMTQPFSARDDFQIAAGQAEFVLDIEKVDRRFGLATEPEPREPHVLDLPLPISGNRAEFTELLIENASKHPWANLPVKLSLTVEDGLGQTGQSETRELPLPGRRFFDPLAAAVIEMRRDLLWSAENAPRTLQVLRTISHRPEGFFRNQRAYLMLRVAMRRLEAGIAEGPLDPSLRDELAEALWEIAVLVEDGGLSDALERMERAQERLSEAMRNGASPEEIAELMDELREATDAYIRQLAQQGEQQPGDQMAQGEGQQITGDQLQAMMDEIQRLMEEGRMAEAQELLEQLNRMMQNMRVTQGEGGEGDMPGGQAMQDLAETLRDQQGLSDETFRDLQEQFNPGGQQPGEGQQGEGQQPGEGEQGEGQGQGQGEGSLADRQQALRDELERQQGGLPGQGTESGNAARGALDRAGRAMDEAERALREGDTGSAIDRQAEAIEELREGMRSLGEALAEERGERQPGEPGPGEERQAQEGAGGDRDPLGRTIGRAGRSGSDENMLQGEDVYRRARDLLDEIRRRAGEQERPELELDYLRRLLDRF
ncbi:TIGR02302 family protein [Frigidibacter albus]|uniref:TIGR02302 family protein n=1 Tax=Frigidibacter albus TaxID=1465486 RepID=A0A6L8VF11_9RHOB|nr:TIGR02302 family protein [Frigidibacter albus]MZQ87859.1 TIGR02302 family protein [Frigidibacter albus]NBE29765.1 TIGR02302 family protein [Frigidibacter albus]GGH42880.1 ATPase [Frigidibacter albus]